MDIEQTTLIWIFRVIYLLVSLLLSWGIWQYVRRERVITRTRKGSYQVPKHIDLPEKNIVLTLVAKPGIYYNVKDLFTILDKLGFRLSNQQVFEYFLSDQKTVAFYLLNIQDGGYFEKDPSNMRSTPGLTAIMQLPILNGSNQIKYFHLLLSVLESLRIELNATICDQNKQSIRNNKLYVLQKEIENFEQNYSILIQNDYQKRILQRTHSKN